MGLSPRGGGAGARAPEVDVYPHLVLWWGVQGGKAAFGSDG